METTAQEPQPLATPQQDGGAEHDWLTYAEAATLIGCSTKTLQRRVKAREITPYLRHGSRHWWFKTEDISRMLVG